MCAIFGATSVRFAAVLDALALARVGLLESRKYTGRRVSFSDGTGRRALACEPDEDEAPNREERAIFAAELAASAMETKQGEGKPHHPTPLRGTTTTPCTPHSIAPLDKEILHLEPLEAFDRVLRIRRARQGGMHLELAKAYVHKADAHWTEQQYDQVVKLYGMAIHIFTETQGGASKPVAQLYGWCGLAHIYASQWEQAHSRISQAMPLVDKAFETFTSDGVRSRRGRRSWEYWRLKHDLIYVLSHSEASEEGWEGHTKQPLPNRFSFKSAEREEVQANELRKELVGGGVVDDAIRLSILVPKRRAQLRRCKREELQRCQRSALPSSSSRFSANLSKDMQTRLEQRHTTYRNLCAAE
ncbi:MAG: hypothetical protein SGPRY_005203 [Prymnesium sp.]